MFYNLSKKIRSIISHEIRCVINESLVKNREYMDSVGIKRLLFSNAAMNLKYKCLNCKVSGIAEKKYDNTELIVSLTTYGKRLYEVALTIESIMQGSLKPNRIILWLQNDLKGVELPLYLCLQKERGLQIEYCENILSYKKLIPTLSKYPDACIVTIDDDVIYEADMLERLVNAWKKDKECIHACRVHKMFFDDTLQLANYLSWKGNVAPLGKSPFNFFTGVGGVLYPPHCFAPEVFDSKTYLNICRYGDDIWFYAMALINGYYVNKIFTHDANGEDYLMNFDLQYDSLSTQNNNENACRNDVQIKEVFEKYGIYDILRKQLCTQ